MIQLNSDYLIFRTSDGENIPCSAELVTIELIGESISQLDPELVHNASAAVLHYFKDELGKVFVTVGEFSLALERVLRGLGLKVVSDEPQTSVPHLPGTMESVEADLLQVASAAGKGFELLFFCQLRDELREQLKKSPELVRFKGLRGCVKELTGARRWSHRCQELNDQIVEFLRNSLSTEKKRPSCGLVVQ
jgi:hypothetical protein